MPSTIDSGDSRYPQCSQQDVHYVQAKGDEPSIMACVAYVNPV
jgi:hypothetical protein